VGAFFATGVLADDAPPPGTSDIGQIQVQGVGNDAASTPGVGLIIPEETPKAKSTVTRAFLDTQRSSENFAQSLRLLPGMNQQQDDAYGLSGGTFMVRGLNSSQIGVTLDGVPLNDASSYAIFVNEYIISEDTQEIYITQGATDPTAPHVGASGGNIVITSLTPSDTMGGYMAESFGQYNYQRFYARAESGLLSTGTKFFLAGETTYAHQWDGPGDDRNHHVDFKLVQQIGQQSDITLGVFYNNEYNNFYRKFTMAQYAANGNQPLRYDSVYTPGDTNFYKLQINPFENLTASAPMHFQLIDDLRLIVTPYYWYGYGNGGGASSHTDLGTLTATPPGGVTAHTVFSNPTEVINIPGLAKGANVTLYQPSNTETWRPGIQSVLEYHIANQIVSGGIWFEDNRQTQTGPYSLVDGNGNIMNPFGTTDPLTDQFTNAPLEKRDSITHNIVVQPYLEDDSAWFNDSLKVSLAMRRPSLTRDVNNEQVGTPPAAGYLSKTYTYWLPQIGVNWEFMTNHSIFGDFTKNAHLPQNFVFTDPVTSTGFQKPETSSVGEIGYRYQDPAFLFQIDAFNTQLHNRSAQAEIVLPNTTTNDFTDTNVGSTLAQGFELQTGYQVLRDISAFASGSYTQANYQNSYTDFPNEVLPIAGKFYIDTPKWMTSFAMEYADNSRQLTVDGGPYAGVEVKWTDKRFSTQMNDESVPSYTTVDAHVGYHFGAIYWVQDPVIVLNVTNLFDTHYFGEMTSNTNAKPVVTPGGTIGVSDATYLLGAGRTISMTLSAKF
jgi:iron complex outermembrane receptor protein